MYVLYVPHVTHRGQLYPPQPHPESWMAVFYEFARKNVKNFISTLDEDIQELVHKNVQKEYPELHLQDFGTVFSDAYRLPLSKKRRSAGLEENVTTLMGMDLATRSRALQVLEGTGNDLEAAVNLLLGTYGFD
jgi:hypothetical protein